MFVLLQCYYEGDSWLIDNAYIASSNTIEALVAHAHTLGATQVFLPGEIVPDDGHYGDARKRFRVAAQILV